MRKPSSQTLTRYRQIVQCDFTIYTKLLDSQCDVIPPILARSGLHVKHWIAAWDGLARQLRS